MCICAGRVLHLKGHMLILSLSLPLQPFFQEKGGNQMYESASLGRNLRSGTLNSPAAGMSKRTTVTVLSTGQTTPSEVSRPLMTRE